MKKTKKIKMIMTVRQLAEYLQINELTIYKKVKLGEIPTVKVGKIIRFKRDIIDRWLEIESGWDQEFEVLLKKSQLIGEQAGITESEVQKAIKKTRDKEK